MDWMEWYNNLEKQSWSPRPATMLFGLRNLPLASVDVFVVWATILWAAWAVWSYHRSPFTVTPGCTRAISAAGRVVGGIPPVVYDKDAQHDGIPARV